MVGLYPYVLFLHVAFVAVFVGVTVANEVVLSANKRAPNEALSSLIKKKLGPLEAVSAAGALLLGLVLLAVNPQGFTIMKSGGWSHMKVTFGILSTGLILVSHLGLGDDSKRWVRPVRGVAQLFMVLALFAIEALRYL